MLQNGDKVEVKKTDKSEWVGGFVFVGMTESGEYLCEQKGGFSRFFDCKKVQKKPAEPMGFEDICQLLSWNVYFKHENSGAICTNPTVSQIMTDPRVLIDGRFVTEMLWAIPEDAASGKWSRCEVESEK
jgi:hypothetical protein